jgi:hypothetical protein
MITRRRRGGGGEAQIDSDWAQQTHARNGDAEIVGELKSLNIGLSFVLLGDP